jgi:3-oxoadipate enol-lactonase
MVLIHAFPFSGHYWDEIIPAMEDRIDVIAVHLPGTISELHPQTTPATMATLADCLRETLTELKVGEAILVGSSMGGYVALEAWRQWSHRIAGLCLLGTRADADDEAGKARRQALLDRIEAEGPGFFPSTMAQNLLGETTKAQNPGLVKRVESMIASIPTPTIQATQHLLANRPDSTSTLRTIRVPTLIAVGEEDRISPPEVSEAMARQIPGARLFNVQGAGHLLPLEKPDAVNKLLHRFLDSMGTARLERLGLHPPG